MLKLCWSYFCACWRRLTDVIINVRVGLPTFHSCSPSVGLPTRQGPTTLASDYRRFLLAILPSDYRRGKACGVRRGVKAILVWIATWILNSRIVARHETSRLHHRSIAVWMNRSITFDHSSIIPLSSLYHSSIIPLSPIRALITWWRMDDRWWSSAYYHILSALYHPSITQNWW